MPHLELKRGTIYNMGTNEPSRFCMNSSRMNKINKLINFKESEKKKRIKNVQIL